MGSTSVDDRRKDWHTSGMTFAYEFDARVEPGKPLQIPKEISDRIPDGAQARIILMIGGSVADQTLKAQETALRPIWDDPAEDRYGEI